MMNFKQHQMEAPPGVDEIVKKEKEGQLPNIYIVDVETSGLAPFPENLVYSIGISEVNIEKGLVKPVYNQVLGYETDKLTFDQQNAWIFDNTDLSLGDIQKAFTDGQKALDVGKEVHLLLKNQFVAYYNKQFDYGWFLKHPPFFLKEETLKNLPCLMVAATKPCAIPRRGFWGEFKYPTLQEAAEKLLDNETKEILKKSENFHSPDYDTLVAGHIMLAMIREGYYDVFKFINEF